MYRKRGRSDRGANLAGVLIVGVHKRSDEPTNADDLSWCWPNRRPLHATIRWSATAIRRGALLRRLDHRTRRSAAAGTRLAGIVANLVAEGRLAEGAEIPTEFDYPEATGCPGPRRGPGDRRFTKTGGPRALWNPRSCPFGTSWQARCSARRGLQGKWHARGAASGAVSFSLERRDHRLQVFVRQRAQGLTAAELPHRKAVFPVRCAVDLPSTLSHELHSDSGGDFLVGLDGQ